MSKKRSAAPAANPTHRPLRLEYLPAADLDENPANWRLHPPDQITALDEAIGELGWAGALLYNERTHRLLDGHARRKLFAARGGEVPVLIGDWDEETERKILATLDPLGDLATTDTASLEALTAALGDSKSALRMAAESKLAAMSSTSVPVASLRPHPRNYKEHPPEQIEHLIRSLTDHGFYRAVVIARDNTILAGHGVWQAAVRMGKTWIPVVRMAVDPDDPQALKVLASDNEIGQLADRNDRALTDMLKELLTDGGDDALMGTGYDAQQLAALAYVTRPGMKTFDAAAEWAGLGMPDYDPGQTRYSIMVLFRNPEDRDAFVKKTKLEIVRRGKKYAEQNKSQRWAAWWPAQTPDDVRHVRWEGDE